jgi:hypothetical protein
MHWYEEYIGKLWEAIPNPPHSFTCGELVRYIYKTRLGIDTPLIYADPSRLDQCIVNLEQPEAYGLHPFEGVPRPFDIVYAMRFVKRDHMGMAVMTTEGLMILHCQQGIGVVLESAAEIIGTTGARFLEWRRHKDVSEELALCKA